MLFKDAVLVHWNDVRNTVTRVHDDACVHARAVQRQQSLHGDVAALKSELKHRLVQLLSVLRRVPRCFGDNDVLVAGLRVQNVEAVLPDLLHLGPVSHLAVLDWIGQVEQRPVLVYVRPNDRVREVYVRLGLLERLAAERRLSDAGGKRVPWDRVLGGADLHVARSVVDDHSRLH